MSSTKLLTSLSAEEIHKFVADQGLRDLVPDTDQAVVKGGKGICVALLAHDARLFVRTAAQLIEASAHCGKLGWGFGILQRDGDSMVARGRSFLASQFLYHEQAKQYTDLVMIDTDLSFRPEDFIKLCQHDVDIVAAAYPYKQLEPVNFPLRWSSAGVLEEDGLWEVQAVTPGFCRVTRKALQKIANELPWLEFKDPGNKEGDKSFMFFDNLHRSTGIYDEGYVFCERWRICGGKVYLDPDINLGHIGIHEFRGGTLRQWLEKKAEQFTHLESEYPGIPPLKLMQKAMGGKIDLAEEKAKLDAAKVVELRPGSGEVA